MKKIYLLFLVSSSLFAQKQIIINLATQKFTAIENNVEVISGKITSGKAGYLTPQGTFSILEKERMHISNRYPVQDKELNIRGGAKMPYALRLTNTGVFIHAGEMPGRPDSHGCVRVKYGNAMKLFKWAEKGTIVKVTGKTPLGDPVNSMRLSMQKKKYSKPKVPKKRISYNNKPIKWIERSLSYYDDL